MRKLTQPEMHRKLSKGFNIAGNRGQIRQFYGSISETGFLKARNCCNMGLQ